MGSSPSIQSDKSRKGSDVVMETDTSLPVAAQVCEGKPAPRHGDDPVNELQPKNLVDQSEVAPPGVEAVEHHSEAKVTDEEFRPKDTVELRVEEPGSEEKDQADGKSARRDGGMSEAAGGSLMAGFAEELSRVNVLTDDRATTDERALRAAPYTLISQFLSLVSSDDDSMSDDDASDAQRKSRSRPSPLKGHVAVDNVHLQPGSSGSVELSRPQSLNSLLTTLYEKRRGAHILRQIQDNGEKIQEKINARDFGYRRRDLLAHELSKDTLSDVASVHSAKSDQTGSNVSPDHKRPVVCALDELQRVPPRRNQKPLRGPVVGGTGASCPSGQPTSACSSPANVYSNADLECQSPLTKTETKASDAEEIIPNSSIDANKKNNVEQLATGDGTVDASNLRLPPPAADQSFDISCAAGTEAVLHLPSQSSIPTTPLFDRNFAHESERNEQHDSFPDQLNLPELVEPPPLSPLQHGSQKLAFVLPIMPAYRTAFDDEVIKPCQREDFLNSSVGTRERRDSADGESLRVILSELHSRVPEQTAAVDVPVCTGDKRNTFRSPNSTDDVFPEKQETFSSLQISDKLSKSSDLNRTVLCSNDLRQLALAGTTDVAVHSPSVDRHEAVIPPTGGENVDSSCCSKINDMVISPYGGRLTLPSCGNDVVHELFSGDDKPSGGTSLLPGRGDVVEIPPNCPLSTDVDATVGLALSSDGASTSHSVTGNRSKGNACKVKPTMTEERDAVRAAFQDQEGHAENEPIEQPPAGSQIKPAAAASPVSHDRISLLPKAHPDEASNNSGPLTSKSLSQRHDPDLIRAPDSVSTENKEKMEEKLNLAVPTVSEAEKSELETKKTSSKNSDEPFGDVSGTSTSDELLSSRQTTRPSKRRVPLTPDDPLATSRSVRRSSNPNIYKVQASLPERFLLAKPQKGSDEPLGDISSTSDELSSRQNLPSKRKVPLVPVDFIVHGHRRSSNPHIQKIQTSYPDSGRVVRCEKLLPATPSSSTSSSSSSSSRRRMLPSCTGIPLSVGGRNGIVEQNDDSSSSPRQQETLPGSNSPTVAQVPRPPIGPMSQDAIIAARARSVIFAFFVTGFFCHLSSFSRFYLSGLHSSWRWLI